MTLHHKTKHYKVDIKGINKICLTKKLNIDDFNIYFIKQMQHITKHNMTVQDRITQNMTTYL